MKFKKIPFLHVLENIVDNRGKTCPTEENGFPLIATNCIRNENLYPSFEKVRYISDDTYKNWFRGHPKPDDIIFVTKGSPGRVCWTPNPVNFCIAQDMVAIRANSKIIYPKYLLALLRSPVVQGDISNMHVGTLIPHFKKGDFDKLLLSIHVDYEEQVKIGDLYFTYCEKIELNRQMNATLEAMAQAMFREWFIDFEFPNENGEKYKSSGGKMVDSELGEIPKGWEVATIKDITEIVTKGTTPTTLGRKFTDEGVNYIKVQSITEEGAFIKSKFGFIDEATHQLLKRSIIKEGDVLFSIAGTIGRVAVATKYILPANTNQAIAVIRPNQVDSHFLKLLMKSTLIQNDTKANVVQAVQANLSLGVIKATKFIKPSSKILSLFKYTLSEVFEKMNLLEEENESLVNTRDLLLPKLMSGEVEV